jgi:hypothetical protein
VYISQRFVATFGVTLLALASGRRAYGDPGAAPADAAGAGAASARAASPCRDSLPSPALAFPSGSELEFHLDAVGVQVYSCKAGAAGEAWVFVAPEATLYDRNGKVAGKHYAGPTWEGTDGSKVVAAGVASAKPDPASIPWLLLGAASHAGKGKMADVTFVQRLKTAGGIAPASGCDAGKIGAVARVPYTATYCFAEAGR